MIYATVGTHHQNFDRLIIAMDAIAKDSDEEVIIQTGLNTRLPDYATYFEFKPRDEVVALQARARVIVTHAGIGSVGDALRSGVPFIVVPRLKRHNEHNTNHQLELADAVKARNWARVITDIDELEDACAAPPEAHTPYRPAKQFLIDNVRKRVLTSVQ